MSGLLFMESLAGTIPFADDETLITSKTKNRPHCLQSHHFIIKTIACYGVNDVALGFGILALYVCRPFIPERMENLKPMVVATDAALEVRVLQCDIVEILSYVVIEQKHSWCHVHGYEGAADAVGEGFNVLLDVAKVGHVVRVVILIGICVKAYHMEERSVKAEIVFTIHIVVGMFARA